MSRARDGRPPVVRRRVRRHGLTVAPATSCPIEETSERQSLGDAPTHNCEEVS